MTTAEVLADEPRPGLAERAAARLYAAGPRAVGNAAGSVLCFAFGGFSALWNQNGALALVWVLAGLLQAYNAFVIHGFCQLCARYDDRIGQLEGTSASGT